MNRILRLGLFGFLSWLAIFGASVCLYPVKSHNPRLFESLMCVVLTTCTVGFTVLYFRSVRSGFVREGVLLGLAFFACNILFDLPMFSAGPMQIPLSRYWCDIGIAYLSMPIMSIGFGRGFQRTRMDRPNGTPS